MDALADQAAVGLQLGFTRPPGPDSTSETLQVGPLADQAGQQILVLGQFNLELAFVSAGVPAKYVENQGGPVDNFDLQRAFHVALLGGCEFVIEDYNPRLGLGHQLVDLFQLTFAHVGMGVTGGPLGDLPDNLCPGGLSQVGQFPEGVLQTPRVAVVSQFQGHQDGPFGLDR